VCRFDSALGRARWGVSGALSPEIRLCGVEFPTESFSSTGTCPWLVLIGHRATNGYEPRQVREEAAVSIAVCVVDISDRSYNADGP
jgi:hypothetical protein